jgi:hypothetical protein
LMVETWDALRTVVSEIVKIAVVTSVKASMLDVFAYM